MALAVENLSIDLGGRRIVSAATFAAGMGELVGLVGANSVGKSTLMRAIAGLIPSSGGLVSWQGVSVLSMSAAARAKVMAYMPQGQTFHWAVSVRHVVALGRLPHLGPLSRMTARDEDIVEKAMERADITRLADRFVTELSGGERSRVLFARALAVQAPMLLADEPTAALDPYHQLHTMEMLRGLADEGKLVVAVLHDLSLAARFCDRVIVMSDGRILADAPPQEAMSAEHLRVAYGVEVYRAKIGDESILVPWKRLEHDESTKRAN